MNAYKLGYAAGQNKQASNFLHAFINEGAPTLLGLAGGGAAGYGIGQAYGGNTGSGIGMGLGAMIGTGLGSYLGLLNLRSAGRKQLKELRDKARTGKGMTKQDIENLKVLEEFDRGGELGDTSDLGTPAIIKDMK